MDKQQFLNMEEADQLNYLNTEAATKDFATICAELGMTKEELNKLGYYFVRNKFMAKPMKGYGTTIRSGNEYKDRFK